MWPSATARGLPCQKPPWGRADRRAGPRRATSPGASRSASPISCRRRRATTGRPARAAGIVTAGGVLFVAATDDNRFRAFEAGHGPCAVGDDAPAARQRQPADLSRRGTAGSTSRWSPPIRCWRTRCPDGAAVGPRARRGAGRPPKHAQEESFMKRMLAVVAGIALLALWGGPGRRRSAGRRAGGQPERGHQGPVRDVDGRAVELGAAGAMTTSGAC